MAQSKKSPVKSASKSTGQRKPDKGAHAKKPAKAATAKASKPAVAQRAVSKTPAAKSVKTVATKAHVQEKAKSKAPASASAKAPLKAAVASASKTKVKSEVTALNKKQAPTSKSAKPVATKTTPVSAKAAPAPAAKPAVAAAAKKPVAKAPAAAVVAAGAKAAAPAARAMPAAVHKPSARMMTAPAMPVLPAQPMPRSAGSPKELALKAAEARRQQMLAAAPKKPVSQRHGFKIGESIVYPAHGVGQIVGIEEQEIAGMSLELFVIQIEKDKLTLRVPTARLEAAGIRKLAEDNIVSRAMETLKGRARIKRTMWSRRAQEYEAKINSGDLIAIAEVVRDLYRSDTQPEQSYSERQLYESALDRMAREIAVVDKLDERTAMQRITEVLLRSARGRRSTEEAAGDTHAA